MAGRMDRGMGLHSTRMQAGVGSVHNLRPFVVRPSGRLPSTGTDRDGMNPGLQTARIRTRPLPNRRRSLKTPALSKRRAVLQLWGCENDLTIAWMRSARPIRWCPATSAGGVAFGISCPGMWSRCIRPSGLGADDPGALLALWYPGGGGHSLGRRLASSGRGESWGNVGGDVWRIGAPASPGSRWRSAVDRFRDKNQFIAWARGIGAPVPKTVCLPNGAGAGDHGLSYPVFVKDAWSLSGLGIDRCVDDLDLAEALRGRMDPFQIQEALPPGTVFLNVQYMGSDAGCVFLATTRQILDGWSHRGTRGQSPSTCGRWPIPRSRVGSVGIAGVFALDVAVTGSPDWPRIWVLECNPRWNGSSYFWFTARKLNAAAWTGLVVSCPTDFDSMDLGELEYRPTSGGELFWWTGPDSTTVRICAGRRNSRTTAHVAQGIVPVRRLESPPPGVLEEAPAFSRSGRLDPE